MCMTAILPAREEALAEVPPVLINGMPFDRHDDQLSVVRPTAFLLPLMKQ